MGDTVDGERTGVTAVVKWFNDSDEEEEERSEEEEENETWALEGDISETTVIITPEEQNKTAMGGNQHCCDKERR